MTKELVPPWWRHHDVGFVRAATRRATGRRAAAAHGPFAHPDLVPVIRALRDARNVGQHLHERDAGGRPGTRRSCVAQGADATAKYGKPASVCRAAHIAPLGTQDTFDLDLDKFKGGVALWGAVPAVYDTTRLPMDRGIHVHARVTPDAKKEMDRTYRAVRLAGRAVPHGGMLVSEIDAIYYMVTSVFGFAMRKVHCSYCNWPHLDRDWFSVRPHRRHLCSGCGRHFADTQAGIGNPIVSLREAFGIRPHKAVTSKRKLKIKQADFPGGLQIWGSNPAFIWTSHNPEEGGVHVHAFRDESDVPALDETFGQVNIDGVALDPRMVRVLMAQSALPSIRNRVLPIDCPACNLPHFSIGAAAFTPAMTHTGGAGESSRRMRSCVRPSATRYRRSFGYWRGQRRDGPSGMSWTSCPKPFDRFVNFLIGY